MAIFRIYVEKKPAYAEESARLLRDLRGLLNIGGITGLRLLNRYDVEGIDQALFDACRSTVFFGAPAGRLPGGAAGGGLHLWGGAAAGAV